MKLIIGSTPYLMSRDGLNSAQYDVVATSQTELYTRFLVHLTGPTTVADVNPIDEMTTETSWVPKAEPKDVFKPVC